jgi:predicted transposase/invertase (TIGR01784 family)
MDKAFLDIDEVSTAMDTLKYISADDDVRAIADLRQKTISDYNSGLTVAREEGIEEGMAIGEAKGIAFGIEQTAIAMLANGIPPETVSKCTNLPIEKVQLLQKNNLKIEAL